MAEDLVMLDKIVLEANKSSFSIDKPFAFSGNACLVPDVRIAVDFFPVAVLVLKAKNVDVEAVATIAQKPCNATNIGPKHTVLGPSLSMPPIPVKAVVGGLKPR